MKLDDVEKKFILHWGEMGTKWGINRSVAQIHALLFISPRALNAEEISDTLAIARSNVSTSLRELQAWRLVRVTHELGDRRDYFETLDDVWEIFKVVMDERKRREIDPTREVLERCVEDSKPAKGTKGESHTHEKLSELLGFIETMSLWYDQISGLPHSSFVKVAKAGAKIGEYVGLGRSRRSSTKKN